MTTDKQIAANRANALLSTGPKTAAGKRRSSQNALRHGLARPEVIQDAHELARQFAATNKASEENLPYYLEFACALLFSKHIREVQKQLMAEDPALCDSKVLKRLVLTERYERRAHTKRRRAAEKAASERDAPVKVI